MIIIAETISPIELIPSQAEIIMRFSNTGDYYTKYFFFQKK